MRILMVCLGNICRSPIAEGVLQHKIRQHGLNWTVDSAGTGSYHVGEAPHRFSQKICLSNGIDISHQRARRFKAVDLEKFDIIYVMAPDVHDDIKNMVGHTAPGMHKVVLFLNELAPGSNAAVPDPWYGPEEGYRHVFELISRTCDAIIEKYKRG